MSQSREITVTINGERLTRTVKVRSNLVDFIRDEAGLTGSHVGCEHGVCGACTIEVDGACVRGCLMLAVQADNATITTVEGLAASGRGRHFEPPSAKGMHCSAATAHRGC